MDEQHDEGRVLTVSEALDAVGALQTHSASPCCWVGP